MAERVLSINEIHTLLEIAQKNRQNYDRKKNLTIDISKKCVLIPGFRRDGVGIQGMVRICVMYLAQKAGATYIHVPFINLAHRNSDPIGKSLRPAEWSSMWEKFLNLGEGEFHIDDLADAVGKETLARHLANSDYQYRDPIDYQWFILPSLLDKILRKDISVQNIWSFNLGLCRQPKECNFYLDDTFIQGLKEKFSRNGYIPDEELYSDNYINIAIHIRRGDVWDACQSGSTEIMYRNKFVTQQYYVELLQRLNNLFYLPDKPLCFHIFSDGRADNFDNFVFTGSQTAFLKLETGSIIHNIQFHLCQSATNTLYHLIKAPIFIPGKSTFSVLALILGNSYVLYDRDIVDFYQYDLLTKYIQGNTRFMSLNDMTERCKLYISRENRLQFV